MGFVRVHCAGGIRSCSCRRRMVPLKNWDLRFSCSDAAPSIPLLKSAIEARRKGSSGAGSLTHRLQDTPGFWLVAASTLFDERSRRDKVGGAEAFGEAITGRCDYRAGSLDLTLPAQQSRLTCRQAQTPANCAL